jgi:hypothetical protein
VHLPDLILRRLSDLDDELRLAVDLPGVRGDRRPGLLVVLVEVVVLSSPALDEHLKAVLDEPAYSLGHETDSSFAFCYLFRYPYLHQISLGTSPFSPTTGAIRAIIVI